MIRISGVGVNREMMQSFLFLPFYLAVIIIKMATSGHFFFWDTVQLSSMHAHWFFENHFTSFFLPDFMDSGHPPTWGIYLALWWVVFGKSLLVSHLSVLPFLLGIVRVVALFPSTLLNKEGKFFFLLILFSDPVFLGQATLVSPDIALIFFLLLAFLGVFNNHKLILAIASLGLASVSMRGMMVVSAIAVFLLLYKKEKGNLLSVHFLFQEWKAFFPAGIFAVFFLGFHYLEKGWIGFHSDSPWAPSFESVDLTGFFHNVVVLGWRFVDFGRIGEWIVLILLAIFLLRKKSKQVSSLRTISLLLISLSLFLLPTMLLRSGLLAHRYLLPLFVVLHLLVISLMRTIGLKKYKYATIIVLSLCLAFGNLWIYPRKVSQGWDSTLAHLPYYELRTEMMNYIRQEAIDLQQIGTVFPNTAAQKYIELVDDEQKFNTKDLKLNQYFFYSNVYNDLSDIELDLLFNTWQIERKLEKWGIEVILFKR